MGRLALIADELGEADTATALRKRLAAQLEEWLTGGGADPLVYEPTYGGLCSANGLADKAADFGGGWYNDHHFHYGYFLYAAAAVGRKDPKWLAKWAPSIGHLVRDIANPSCTDELYPQHRFKDWCASAARSQAAPCPPLQRRFHRPASVCAQQTTGSPRYALPAARRPLARALLVR